MSRASTARSPCQLLQRLQLLKGVPVYAAEATGELVTPTGAAIVTALVKTFGAPPPMTMSGVGYGAGSRDIPAIPNLLRLMLGETHSVQADEQVWVLEANIDDMNPELSGFLMERLFAAGALGCYLYSRPDEKKPPGIAAAGHLSVKSSSRRCCRIIFQESTTAGVRYYRAARAVLQRSEGALKTRFGTLKVKIFGSGVNAAVAPEFEECRRIAVQKGVPLKEVYAEVIAAAKRGRRSLQ